MLRSLMKDRASLLTIRRLTNEQSGFYRCWKRFFGSINALQTGSGAWTRRASRSKASENFLPCSRQRKRHGRLFLLTAKRNKTAVKRFFDKAICANGDPEKVAIDHYDIEQPNHYSTLNYFALLDIY